MIELTGSTDWLLAGRTLDPHEGRVRCPEHCVGKAFWKQIPNGYVEEVRCSVCGVQRGKALEQLLLQVADLEAQIDLDALSEPDAVLLEDLYEAASAVQQEAEVATSQIALSLSAYECVCVRRAVLESGGDVSKAAKLLHIGVSTMYRHLKRHGLN